MSYDPFKFCATTGFKQTLKISFQSFVREREEWHETDLRNDIKGIVHPRNICHHLFTLNLFQTCVTLLNKKKDIWRMLVTKHIWDAIDYHVEKSSRVRSRLNLFQLSPKQMRSRTMFSFGIWEKWNRNCHKYIYCNFNIVFFYSKLAQISLTFSFFKIWHTHNILRI